jgi:hypothetical protein
MCLDLSWQCEINPWNPLENLAPKVPQLHLTLMIQPTKVISIVSHNQHPILLHSCDLHMMWLNTFLNQGSNINDNSFDDIFFNQIHVKRNEG